MIAVLPVDDNGYQSGKNLARLINVSLFYIAG